MTTTRPLLMIPGPVEVSPAVQVAASGPPPGHLSPALVAAFGQALADMRRVWLAGEGAAAFAVPGGGTLAMEAVATNLVAPGERALVVSTGYFGDRMAEMLRRRGAEVVRLAAPPGEAPAADEVEAELARQPCKAVFLTHVDTSTGVRVDPPPFLAAARRHGALSVVDGVCATAGERFEMAAWDADVYLTASQKALGLPPGLALWVASERALAARITLKTPPPMTFDWELWRPVMEAYEAGRGAYFSTPPTPLVAALAVGLREILDDGGVEACFARHACAADALRAAWNALGLRPVPARPELQANTLSALYWPEGKGNEMLAAIRAEGVIVAGGLHPELGQSYFRIGHMGWVTRSREPLRHAVAAIGGAIAGRGSKVVQAAVDAFVTTWAEEVVPA